MQIACRSLAGLQARRTLACRGMQSAAAAAPIAEELPGSTSPALSFQAGPAWHRWRPHCLWPEQPCRRRHAARAHTPPSGLQRARQLPVRRWWLSKAGRDARAWPCPTSQRTRPCSCRSAREVTQPPAAPAAGGTPLAARSARPTQHTVHCLPHTCLSACTGCGLPSQCVRPSHTLSTWCPRCSGRPPPREPGPCAGSVKGLTSQQLLDLDCHVILGNTYHLASRPGPELVADMGGLHGFVNWPRGMLTDSGGFQVAASGPPTPPSRPRTRMETCHAHDLAQNALLLLVPLLHL